VDATLAEMTLEEKAGQMVMLRIYGYYTHPESAAYREMSEAIREMRPGGVVLFQSEVESIPPLLRSLQDVSELPLLVAADMEQSMAFRVRRGTAPLPYAMAVGATRSVEAARFTGEVTAREGKALGVHWALAPVADVNNNPANPVISVRSYSEDPELVGRMARAFVEGVQEGGLLASAKHFPGHGDTALDSHFALPSIQADGERLDSVELPPFRHAVEGGVASIMTAHVAVPALDPSGLPATRSPILAEGLLRRKLGFQGLIVTDSMGMAGVRKVAWTGKATVQAVLAGADVLLLPPDPPVAVQALVRAVREGQLTEERLNVSVRRILEAKARLGLHEERMPEGEALRRDVARPEDLARTQEIAAASVTVVRNEGGVLPLKAEEPLQLLHLEMATRPRSPWIRGIPQEELRRRGIPVKTLDLGGPITAKQEAEVLALADDATHILASVFPLGTSAILPPSQARLLGALTKAGHRLVVTSFGSPYLLRELPPVPVFVTTYGGASSSQHAAMAALFGEAEVRGKLPVTLSGGTLKQPYPFGHGLEIPQRLMTLETSKSKDRSDATPQDLGLLPGGLAKVDQVVEDFLEQKAFPGAVLAVGYRGNLVHLNAFGHLTYDEGSPAVRTDTIYDLASLTKVIATTTMATMLVDQGKLDLETPEQDFLPLFIGEGKEGEAKKQVTVRHLLTHSAGVDWGAPLYQELQGPVAYLERIQGMDLVYEPGSRSLYSDLGLMLLGEILQRVAGTSLDDFVEERVFEPLGMEDTLYRPGKELFERIAPTELDAEWRGRILRGDVHDENAFALGGVAPHAGLFGTAPDLARFAQMIVNGGVFEHQRFFSRATLEEFTTRATVPDSSRALGWDTKSEEGSSAGTLFSPSSFGHTGYTGTSLWIDPERDLFVILLTNRVHPPRENILIRKVRPAVADAVIRALAEP